MIALQAILGHMPKDGRDLQRLIRSIESAKAAGRQDLKIESPAFLIDKLTGKKREHDVLLTYKLDHHEVIMALECRDRSRPIGIDAVEAFRSKCESTGVHRGIMVSSKGFSKPAITKAVIYNIGCLTLDEVDSFNWCLAPGIVVRARHIIHVHLNVNFPEGTDRSGTIVTEDGKLCSSQQINAMAGNILTNSSDKVSFEDGQHQVPFYMVGPSLFMQSGDDRVQAVNATFTITYEVKNELALFKFRKYADATNAAGITEAAVATMPIGGDKTADFVLPPLNSSA
jgi:hypothetical protein